MKDLEDEILLNKLSISWIGQIPDSWDIQALGKLVEIILSNADKKINDGETKVSLCNYTDVYYKKRIDLSLSFLEASATDLEIHRFQLKVNDVLITKDSETPDDIAVPSLVTEVKKNLLCGYHLAILRPLKHKIDGGYLFFSLMSESSRAQFSSLATGITRFGIGNNDIKNVRLCLPPLATQKSIAHFLDRKTVAIDTLIAKKQRLIQLLEEKRTALINQAVTKGLNDLEVLEEIKLKYLKVDKFQYGANESSDRDELGEPRYIRITDINEDGSLREDTHRTLSLQIAEPYLLNDGDILLARSGATVGKSFIYSANFGEACFAGYLIRLRLNKKKSLPKFIWYYTQSLLYKHEIELSIIQATIQNVSAERYGEFRLLLPSLISQKQIVTFLDLKTNEFNTIISKTKSSIEKLQEYRRSLITAAVTGKQDIHNLNQEI